MTPHTRPPDHRAEILLLTAGLCLLLLAVLDQIETFSWIVALAGSTRYGF